LESSTWFPNGTYVEGGFVPAPFSNETDLYMPSFRTVNNESRTNLGSGDTDTESLSLARSPILDAMDISVNSIESREELDRMSSNKHPTKSTTMSKDTPSRRMSKMYTPIKVLSPPDRGGKTMSKLKACAHKKESASSSANRRIRWRDPDVKKYCTYKKEDVLFGRGGKSNLHYGNKVYRKRILAKQLKYQALPNNEKRRFSEMIIDWVHEECKGRFMMKDKIGWFEVTLEKALLKVSQALREDHSPEGKRRKKANAKPTTKGTGAKKNSNSITKTRR
jgi:hypothetical protein